LPFHENHLCQASESALPLFCTLWPTWNHRKTLNLTQSSTLMRCFRCSNHCSFLNSLIKDARKKQQSPNSHHFLKIYFQLKFSSPLLSLLLKILEQQWQPPWFLHTTLFTININDLNCWKDWTLICNCCSNYSINFS